jgi:ribosome-associated protein
VTGRAPKTARTANTANTAKPAKPAKGGPNARSARDTRAVQGPDEPTRRQLARKAIRREGDQSSRLARALMTLPLAKLNKLGLDADLRREIDRCRRITALVARRREERHLGGVLRTVDGNDLAARLAKVEAGGDAANRPFHSAESWRTRLLTDGPKGLAALLAEHPTADGARLGKLVEDAVREKATGKPPGAARALFRAILAVLDAPAAEPAPDEDSEDEDEDEDTDDATDDATESDDDE